MKNNNDSVLDAIDMARWSDTAIRRLDPESGMRYAIQGTNIKIEKIRTAYLAEKQANDDARAADKQRIAELELELEPLRKMTELTLGVGYGEGKLFVHGDYDGIKWLQERLLNRGDEVQEAYKRGYEEGNEEGFLEGYNEKEQELT